MKYRHGEDAAEAKEHLNHTIIGGREIRIVFAEENRKTPQEMRVTSRGRSDYSFELLFFSFQICNYVVLLFLFTDLFFNLLKVREMEGVEGEIDQDQDPHDADIVVSLTIHLSFKISF